jgi:GAF domain-containing protein
VNDFPGHIACDGETKSEIVVPLIWNNEVVGVLDIDSPNFSRFDDADAAGLKTFAELILNSVDWETV